MYRHILLANAHYIMLYFHFISILSTDFLKIFIQGVGAFGYTFLIVILLLCCNSSAPIVPGGLGLWRKGRRRGDRGTFCDGSMGVPMSLMHGDGSLRGSHRRSLLSTSHSRRKKYPCLPCACFLQVLMYIDQFLFTLHNRSNYYIEY